LPVAISATNGCRCLVLVDDRLQEALRSHLFTESSRYPLHMSPVRGQGDDPILDFGQY
jgi:hypothetical protein